MSANLKVWTWLTEYPSWWWSNTYVWWGKSFNPTENLVYWYWQTAQPIIYNESSNFIMTWVNAWTEVLLWLIVFTDDEYRNWEYWIQNPNWEWIWWPSITWTATWWWWFRQWFGIWFRHWEIDINWTYTIVCRDYNNTSYNVNKLVTVNNITSQLDRHDSWYIWVEWSQIWFIDWCNAESWSRIWYKHLIDNDWVSYTTWKTPGMIWVDQTAHGKISFIDSSWVHRKTRLADNYWVPYDWSNLPQSWKTPGMIWVADTNQFHWTYLFFVWYDWNVYRISHSSPFWY